MSLSCYCGDASDGAWWYYGPSDYTRLTTKRGRRCCSCRDLIPVGTLAVEFTRERAANGYIEERIHGDEVSIPSWWMCERCGDLYFSLDELGFCITLSDDMRALVREYGEMQREERDYKAAQRKQRIARLTESPA